MSSSGSENVTPSAAHLALALVTVRSKPADIPLDDYLDMLSNCMIQKPTISTQNGQFDTALFWKKAYQRVEAEKSQLQEYIHRIERGRLEAASLDSPSPHKRKADTDEPPVRANTQSRRREVNRSSSPVAKNDNIRALLRHVFHLKCLLRSHSPAVDQLCLRIGALCQSHEALLDSLSKTRATSTPSNQHGLEPSDILSAFVASYPSILEAIDYATNKEAPDNVLTIANASIVQLFQATLGQLHRLALDEVTRQEEEEQSKGKKPRSNTKVATKDFQQVKASLEAQSEVFVQMLGNMLTSIDPTKDSHCELLEGLLCALLDHAASSLSLMVFADPGAPRGHIGIEAPRGLDDVAHIKTKVALTAAEVEAPYVMTVVKKGLHFLRNNQGQMSAYMQDIFSWYEQDELTASSGSGGGGPGALRKKIEARLQGTLLRGVFGDDDPAFDNALTRELTLDNKDMQRIKTDLQHSGDKSTWFIGQMWEELGWQILQAKQSKQAK